MTETTPDTVDGTELIKTVWTIMRSASPVPDDPDEARAMRLAVANIHLDQYPFIDQLADLSGIASFLKLKSARSIQRNKSRTWKNGRPAWPPADARFGKSDAWQYRTVVLHLAEAGGTGRRRAQATKE